MIYSMINQMVMNISSGENPRYAPYFDGLTQYGVLSERAIDVDGDVDVEFWTPDSVEPGRTQVIVGQSISTNQGNKEFEIFVSGSTGNLGLTVGGNTFAAMSYGTYSANRKYRLYYSGNLSVVTDLLDGTEIIRTFTRGTEREPLAQTTVAANASLPSSFFQGLMPDIKINGTYWLLDQRNNPVQPSNPSSNNLTIINHTEAMWRRV